MRSEPMSNPYPVEPIVNLGELPDLFMKEDGSRVSRPEEWAARGRAWRDLVVETEYGGMPPAPKKVDVEPLCRSQVGRWPSAPMLWSYRVHCHGGEMPFSFCVRMLVPQGDGPFPAIINGDGCWWYINDEVAQRVVERKCALVMFNRTEMAEDNPKIDDGSEERPCGSVYAVYPGRSFGALSAWAWGYHRCVDMLQRESCIDSACLAVSGHSRGGKTVLLAGATDERIALVNDNASCAAGSAVFRYVGHGGESLEILNVFPSWFGRKAGLRSFIGREDELPFDQHCLLAAIAPRLLLLTFALDDRWSNPEGMVQSAWAVREVYRFLGAEDRLAFHLRPGPHAHSLEDWEVLLDFIGYHWQGREATAAYNRHPYKHLKPAFSWRAPGCAH